MFPFSSHMSGLILMKLCINITSRTVSANIYMEHTNILDKSYNRIYLQFHCGQRNRIYIKALLCQVHIWKVSGRERSSKSLAQDRQ